MPTRLAFDASYTALGWSAGALRISANGELWEELDAVKATLPQGELWPEPTKVASHLHEKLAGVGKVASKLIFQQRLARWGQPHLWTFANVVADTLADEGGA